MESGRTTQPALPNPLHPELVVKTFKPRYWKLEYTVKKRGKCGPINKQRESLHISQPLH
jgi:hypothetical protein